MASDKKHAPRANRPSAAAGDERGAGRHCFGSHLSVAGGLQNAIHEARRLHCDTVQIFVKNQRQWSAAALSEEAVKQWRAARSEGPLGPVVAHASYLINLGSDDAELSRKSIAALADELDRCGRLGVEYLVVHPGAAGKQPVEAAVARVSRAVDAVFAATPPNSTTLLLETTAGQGTTLGRTFTELGRMLDGVDAKSRVGVCVDTCHVFAAGYDIRERAAYEAMLNEAAATVGLDRIRAFHLNDSRGKLGSRVDRHDHIGAGQIGPVGFQILLGDARFAGLPMILETPKENDEQGREMDVVNLALLRQWSEAAGLAKRG
ncbi:MAG: deoxyribonuclease IV [Phycisphaerae bacterium]|nr:deoxyribonuclease IV [Phycisphaerae bacterium]